MIAFFAWIGPSACDNRTFSRESWTKTAIC
jgi:hypothetical protein